MSFSSTECIYRKRVTVDGRQLNLELYDPCSQVSVHVERAGGAVVCWGLNGRIEKVRSAWEDNHSGNEVFCMLAHSACRKLFSYSCVALRDPSCRNGQWLAQTASIVPLWPVFTGILWHWTFDAPKNNVVIGWIWVNTRNCKTTKNRGTDDVAVHWIANKK